MSSFIRLAQRSRQPAALLQKRFASHGTSFEPPTGKLFNEPHLAKGEVRQKESYENIWVYGFGGACLFAVIIAANRPDDTLTTWALEEAKARQKAQGTIPTYTKQDQ